MTIKHEIKVDKENKVLTLLVEVPKKNFARDENLSFNGADAWELVKSTRIEGFTVSYTRNGLIIDNWRHCNHTGAYVYPLEKTKQARRAPQKAKPNLKTDDSKPSKKTRPSAQELPVKKNKD